MTHGLSVRAERGHGFRFDAVFLQQRQRRVGEAAGDLEVERCELIERDFAVALSQIENAPTQIFGIRKRLRRDHARRRIETRQRNVNAVRASS